MYYKLDTRTAIHFMHRTPSRPGLRHMVMCEIRVDYKRQGYGESICNPPDKFDMAMGVKMALSRAIQDAIPRDAIDSRRALWLACVKKFPVLGTSYIEEEIGAN